MTRISLGNTFEVNENGITRRLQITSGLPDAYNVLYSDGEVGKLSAAQLAERMMRQANTLQVVEPEEMRSK